ncbi:hypothetical protein RF11_03406 [Thelohanellus kitauei]|uniref:Peptidase A2 domain-containing protein n=1 Tax=Thelohanellus kitauei TaxID=669202 RepID=A0A0C2MSX2_THEKT|nr:hypothetical protein RF11_03406 [Thelohanellus kitauei]
MSEHTDKRVSYVSSTRVWSSLLYLPGKLSVRRYLVDTGAEISVLDPKANDRLNKSTRFTANTFFDFNRVFSWSFLITDVGQAILRADFLRSNYSMLDLIGRKQVLMDTFSSIPCRDTTECTSKLQQITEPKFSGKTCKHGIELDLANYGSRRVFEHIW